LISFDTVERELQCDPALIHRKNEPRNWQPLLYVAYSQFHRHSDDSARGLLARGADPAGTNALNHGLARIDSERTRMLPEHGADPNEVYQPWVRLAELGNARAICTLLQCGFPADIRGTEGGTALHNAGWHGQHHVVAALFEYGAPLEVIEDTFGCTPLGWAAHGCDNWAQSRWELHSDGSGVAGRRYRCHHDQHMGRESDRSGRQ
jgi:hypothetical protein